MISKLSSFLLVLSLYLVSGQQECEFSVEAIQKIFDSYVEFRTLYAFDPTDSSVAVTKFSEYRSWEGYNAAE